MVAAIKYPQELVDKIFVMRYESFLSPQEISQEVGLTTRAVRHIINKAAKPHQVSISSELPFKGHRSADYDGYDFSGDNIEVNDRI